MKELSRQVWVPFLVPHEGEVEGLTASLHESFRKVCEATLLFQRVPTAGMLARALQVDDCFYAVTYRRKEKSYHIENTCLKKSSIFDINKHY